MYHKGLKESRSDPPLLIGNVAIKQLPLFSGGLGDESPNVTQPPYSAISHSVPLNPEQLLARAELANLRPAARALIALRVYPHFIFRVLVQTLERIGRGHAVLAEPEPELRLPSVAVKALPMLPVVFSSTSIVTLAPPPMTGGVLAVLPALP